MSEEATVVSIEEKENGPLLVRNLQTLTLADGQAVECKKVMGLCRCGQSNNKPFCDGSHSKVGFDSSHQDTSARDKVYTYEGAEATVHYNRLLCSHAAQCGAMLKSVFDTSQKPWIQPDKGSVEDIRAVVAACPSGALRLEEKGQNPAHIVSEATEVKVEANGPYWVYNVALKDAAWASTATPQKYVLCRCGQSKNKPFCDGSHYDAGWKDTAS